MRLLTTLLLSPALLLGGEEARTEPRLAHASLEELMNMEISSVSRKQQKLSQTAAAVFVITQDDIVRSGATSLPEVLRLAPGLQVARIDPTKWAVSARGFNGRFANKMLVLIDGRSIYTQIYSGVYWDQYDILLEDIERIEVIRGPGATTWGANAVNGVINIITKTARGSSGGLVTSSAGPADDAYLGARYAGRAGRRGSYRVFTKLSDRGRMAHQNPIDELGGYRTERGGGRFEWELTAKDSLMVQADLYRGGAPQDLSEALSSLDPTKVRPDRADFSGGFLQAEWRRKQERSETQLHWYLNQENRTEAAGSQDARTLDLDFQQRNALHARHDLIWGAGFRAIQDELGNPGKGLVISTLARRTQLWSSFAQDDISLVRNRLVLSAGSKFLHQEFSGFAWQPSARLLWTPNTLHTVWGSATRAVRTPSRRDQDIGYEFPLPASLAPAGVYTRYKGNRAFRPETVLAVEAGYRRQFGERFSVDLAAFRSAYGSLESLRPGAPDIQLQPEFRVTVPLLLGNESTALSRGVELATQWRPARGLRLSTNYSYLSIQQRPAPGTVRFAGASRDPRHQVQSHVAWDVSRRVTFDAFAFGISQIVDRRVPGYVRADVRLAFKMGERGELSAGGRNLLDARHLEFVPEDFVLAQEVRRSAYVRFTWRF